LNNIKNNTLENHIAKNLEKTSTTKEKFTKTINNLTSVKEAIQVKVTNSNTSKTDTTSKF